MHTLVQDEVWFFHYLEELYVRTNFLRNNACMHARARVLTYSRERVEGLDCCAARRAHRRVGGEDEFDFEVLRHRAPIHVVVSVVELCANNRHAHPLLIDVRGVEPEVREALLVRLLQLDRCVNVDLDVDTQKKEGKKTNKKIEMRNCPKREIARREACAP